MFLGTLQSLSVVMIEYGLLGVLVTMPPALLLVLGLKKKTGRWTQVLGGALFVSMACALAGISIEGVETGRGLALSKSTLMVNKAESPLVFWISIAAFLGGSAFIALCGIFLMWRGLRPATKTPGST
jgi:hypothetical protein